MKRLVVLAATILSLLLTIGPSASGQSVLDFDEFGIESGYARDFVNPDALSDTPEPDGGPYIVSMSVMGFSDSDQISDEFEDFAKAYAEYALQGGEYEMEDVSDLGDQAYAIEGIITASDVEIPATVVLALRDSTVFSSRTIGSQDVEMDTEIVTFMLDAEPSDEELDYQSDGTSTGGAFDLMPTSDDIEGLEDLKPDFDLDMSRTGD